MREKVGEGEAGWCLLMEQTFTKVRSLSHEVNIFCAHKPSNSFCGPPLPLYLGHFQ